MAFDKKKNVSGYISTLFDVGDCEVRRQILKISVFAVAKECDLN